MGWGSHPVRAALVSSNRTFTLARWTPKLDRKRVRDRETVGFPSLRRDGAVSGYRRWTGVTCHRAERDTILTVQTKLPVIIVGALCLCLLAMGLWGTWSIIAPQRWLLHAMHQKLGDWGLAIGAVSIVATLLFRGLLFAASPSKKLRALQPEIETIRQRHPADRDRQNLEIYSLYRREGIPGWRLMLPGPLLLVAGWLLVACYVAMWRMSELQGTPFLWIPDLSARDPRYLLPVISMVLSVTAGLTEPTDQAKPRKNRFVGSALAACVVFWFPASFVLFGSVTQVLSILRNLWRRAKS